MNEIHWNIEYSKSFNYKTSLSSLKKQQEDISVRFCALHKRRSLHLRISSVNVTKSAVSGTFTEEILKEKLHFLCSGICFLDIT